MNVLKEIVGVIVSIILVYYGVRILATAFEWYKHKGPEGQAVRKLSFWAQLEKIIQNYRDSGEFPAEGNPTIDWTKASPEDRSRLSVTAINRQVNLLIALNGMSDKLAVLRDGNVLYVCRAE